MKQRVISLMLTVAMGATLLAGCGSSATDSANAGADSGKESAAAAGTESDEKDFSGEGKVINIYSWNDEFRTRLEAVYPEVESTSSDGTGTTLKDGTEIPWVINPNQDGVYQQKLDEALMNQADASADDKVDIFLSETDYVYKYTDAAADVAMPLTDLGIDPETDLADQYDFTRTTASDSDGVQRGSTWQCCPGLLVYRRDIAKDVFGTDDPEAVGEKVKDWATIKDTAAELKAKGYYTFASYADTFRLYGNSIDESWVQPGDTTVKVDQKIINWVSDSKEWLDAGYLDSNIKGQWNDDWNKSMGSQSKVFAFLLPAWGIDFVLNPNWDGESGNWAVTNPPQEYNWGGSYIHAATGTDNVKYAKDIILAMTSNQDNLLKISQDYSDFTNTKSGMAEAAKDDAQNGNGQDDQKTDTGNTSDPTADDQNKGDETPADSTTDPSNDANTSDGGNNGSTTTEVTLAVDDAVADCLSRHVTDWGKLKNMIRDSLSDFMWKRMKRNPMILPIIMEVE